MAPRTHANGLRMGRLRHSRFQRTLGWVASKPHGRQSGAGLSGPPNKTVRVRLDLSFLQ